MKRVDLGSFDIISGSVLVSDPCYSLDVHCMGKLENIQIGQWWAYVLVSDEGNWGNRIAQLEAVYSCVTLRSLSRGWRQETCDIGVDSGQAGIFDAAHYRNDKVVEGIARISGEAPITPDDKWYSFCCDRTMSEEGAGVIPFGVVSSSGFGDGSYTCFTNRNAEGKVVGIRIVFITDEEDQAG